VEFIGPSVFRARSSALSWCEGVALAITSICVSPLKRHQHAVPPSGGCRTSEPAVAPPAHRTAGLFSAGLRDAGYGSRNGPSRCGQLAELGHGRCWHEDGVALLGDFHRIACPVMEIQSAGGVRWPIRGASPNGLGQADS
jgi:hypothetical protein